MAKELKAFRREDRYIVLKLSDLAGLPEAVGRPFAENLVAIQRRLPKRECLVIESDWPEYQAAWQMIEARVNGSGQPTKSGESVEVVGYFETRGRYSGQIFMTEVDGCEPLMTVAQHQRILLSTVIHCEQKGAFKTCMECGYQDGHDQICQYHESKRATHPADQVAEGDADLVALLVECRRLLSAEPHGILSGMADQAKRADWYSAMTPVRDRIDAKLATLHP